MSTIDVEFERDVLAACMKDVSFVRAALPVLRAHDFSSRTLGWIWQQIVDVYSATRELPTAAIYSARIARAYKKAEDQEFVREVLLSLHRRKPKAPRSALEEIRRLVRLVGIRRAAGDMLDGLDEGDIDRAEAALFTGVEEVRASGMLEEPHAWEEQWAERLADYTIEEDDQVLYRMPLPTLNRITGGGLRPGTCGLISALTNVGKSTFAVDVGFNALVHSNAIVVHFTSEETRRECTARYDARFTGIPRDRLLGGKLTKDERRLFGERFERVMAGRKSRLIVHELPPGSPVTGMRPVIERVREDFPDEQVMFVADSPDHWEPGTRVESHRLSQSKVYWYTKGLTLDATLGPIAGWNTTQAPQKYVGKTPNAQAVSETQDKSRIADFMVVLTDSDDDRDDQPTRAVDVVVVKNRLGRVKRWRIYTDADLGICKFEEKDGHAEDEE